MDTGTAAQRGHDRDDVDHVQDFVQGLVVGFVPNGNHGGDAIHCTSLRGSTVEVVTDAPPPPPPQPAATPPPGWYHDGVAMRWWDGRQWGPAAPTSGPNPDDRTLSILTHGGVLVGGFVVPLVFYLIANDEERPERAGTHEKRSISS